MTALAVNQRHAARQESRRSEGSVNSIGRRNTSDPTGNCVFGAPCPDFIENSCLDIGEGRDAGCQTLREDHPDLNAALSTVTPDGVCIAGSAGAGPAGSAFF